MMCRVSSRTTKKIDGIARRIPVGGADLDGEQAIRRRLLDLGPHLGLRTLSAIIRRLADLAVRDPSGRAPWVAVPELKDVALHLDRIASALQRCLLTGSPVGDHLREVETMLARLRDMLGQSR